MHSENSLFRTFSANDTAHAIFRQILQGSWKQIRIIKNSPYGKIMAIINSVSSTKSPEEKLLAKSIPLMTIKEMRFLHILQYCSNICLVYHSRCDAVDVFVNKQSLLALLQQTEISNLTPGRQNIVLAFAFPIEAYPNILEEVQKIVTKSKKNPKKVTKTNGLKTVPQKTLKDPPLVASLFAVEIRRRKAKKNIF